jgi:hypothetical protein
MPRSKIRWTKEKPYIVAIQSDVTRNWSDYGPFHFKAVAAYAAKVIHESVKRGKQPSLAVYSVGHMVVEVLGGNSIKPSPHYRARIADADIYDMSPPDHRAELNYILAACHNAGANGSAP